MNVVGAAIEAVLAGGRARAMDDSIAVVVLTSFSDEDRILDALDAGAIGYLLKGAEPADLGGCSPRP